MRMSPYHTIVLLLACFAAGCGSAPARQAELGTSGPGPPLAARRPHEVPSPFGSRQDEYYWLRDDSRSSNAVLDYLSRENEYTRRWFAQRRGEVNLLYREILGRIKPDDYTVPWHKGGYWY